MDALSEPGGPVRGTMSAVALRIADRANLITSRSFSSAGQGRFVAASESTATPRIRF